MRYIVDLCRAKVIGARNSALIPIQKEGDLPMFRHLVELSLTRGQRYSSFAILQVKYTLDLPQIIHA